MAKVLVSMDERLLARLDREAGRKGLSRSAYLSLLAARELDARPGPGRTAEAGQALEQLDELFAARRPREGTTDAIRRERDAR